MKFKDAVEKAVDLFENGAREIEVLETLLDDGWGIEMINGIMVLAMDEAGLTI